MDLNVKFVENRLLKQIKSVLSVFTSFLFAKVGLATKPELIKHCVILNQYFAMFL